ncbi:unnamed protein product [Candidula unifasciata]|uniref:Uncharacterized protein n=1 Tax=Candidula unifasciata TaxID=100452 RepID=A0A8S4A4E6_9EUPU|nr:unnamed protein product [Candidula unifasciata]
MRLSMNNLLPKTFIWLNSIHRHIFLVCVCIKPTNTLLSFFIYVKLYIYSHINKKKDRKRWRERTSEKELRSKDRQIETENNVRQTKREKHCVSVNPQREIRGFMMILNQHMYSFNNTS